MSETKVCKTGECFSIRRTTNLTYDIGLDIEDQIFIRITKSSRKSKKPGTFSKEWFSVSELFSYIDNHDKYKFASTIWKPLFDEKDNNTAGFLMAVLLKEGFVEGASNKEVKFPIYHRRTAKTISDHLTELKD